MTSPLNRADATAEPEVEQAPERTISRGRSVVLMGATILSALSAIVISAIAKASLTDADMLEFLVFWSVLFAAFGTAGGLQNEATRAVSAVRAGAHPQARVLPAAAILGAACAALFLLSSPLWAPHVIPRSWPWVLPAMALAVTLSAMQAAYAGAFAGSHAWGGLSTLMVLESGARIVFIALAAVVATNLMGFELATMLANAAWILALVAPQLRRIAGSRADVSSRRLLHNGALALVSSAAYAVLVLGFNAFFGATSRVGTARELSMVMLAITLTRAPIMMPLLAFQGVAIAVFTERTGARLMALVKPLVGIMAFGLVGAVAAWLLGPFLFNLIYPGYVLPGWVFAALVLAAVSLAWLTLTGTAAIAASAHRGYMAGWVVGAAASIALLFLPLPPAVRATVALSLGPLVGVAVHLGAIRVADRAAGA